MRHDNNQKARFSFADTICFLNVIQAKALPDINVWRCLWYYKVLGLNPFWMGISENGVWSIHFFNVAWIIEHRLNFHLPIVIRRLCAVWNLLFKALNNQLYKYWRIYLMKCWRNRPAITTRPTTTRTSYETTITRTSNTTTKTPRPKTATKTMSARERIN